MEEAPKGIVERHDPAEEKQPDNETAPKAKVEADYIRHSKASYATYSAIVGSDQPEKPFDHEKQITPDLTPAGVELAEKEAEKYFSSLDPKETVLFFASSNEARAMETAAIYHKAAVAHGFEIIKPRLPNSPISEELTEGDIKKLDSLSINAENLIPQDAFSPAAQRAQIAWDKVTPGLRERYEKAAALIDADDQGSWGANYMKHGEEVAKILPEITTARELYEREFSVLMRQLRFGSHKAAKAGLEKGLKVMAFGHEDKAVYFLKKEFDEEGLKNCEVVNFKIDGDQNVTASYRGKAKQI